MGKTKFNTVGNDERQARRANVLNFMQSTTLPVLIQTEKYLLSSGQNV